MFQSSEKDMEECGPGSPSREGHPVASRSELALEVTSEPPAWGIGPAQVAQGGRWAPAPQSRTGQWQLFLLVHLGHFKEFSSQLRLSSA